MSNENKPTVTAQIYALARSQDATIRELRLEVIGLREQNRKLVEALTAARRAAEGEPAPVEYDPTCALCQFGEEPGHEH